MKYVVKTQPAIEPVSLSDMRTHIGINQPTDTSRDAVITARIVAARQWCEEYTRRKLITQTLVGYQHDFTHDAYGSTAIDLIAPLQSVTSIKYIDTAGVQQTLDQADYIVSTVNACIMPAYETVWPDARSQMESVQIEYVAGYGDAASNVPQPIREAIMFIVSQWEVFQSSIEGVIRPMTIPNAAKELLSNYIDYREVF